MTRLGALMTVAPGILVGSDMAAAWVFVREPGVASAALFFVSLYLLPPLVLRLHALRFPVEPGLACLSDESYCPWYGAHRLQLKYIALPFLESALRLVPGLYSVWLRLWGAKVGCGVYWTPCVEIVDRNLLEIGDGVIFGHRAAMVSHVIKRNRHGALLLYVAPPRIGAGVFVGAKARIGPGAVIADAATVPYDAQISVNERFCPT